MTLRQPARSSSCDPRHRPLRNAALLAAAAIVTLAASARAQRQFEVLHAMPPGGGASALGDVDGDGDLDIVVGAWGIDGMSGQNRLYLNDGMGHFTDATAGRMPIDDSHTASVALGDVDGDGDLDIVFGNGAPDYFPTFGEQNHLCLNDGTGHFTDATAARMPVDSDPTAAVVLGDVDGDRDLDLVCGNNVFWSFSFDEDGSYSGQSSGQSNRLYLNNGAGHFTDATAARMPVNSDPTAAVVLGDVDGDGDLDLVFANGHIEHFNSTGLSSWAWGYGVVNRLYLNDGTGTFTDGTASQLPGGADSAASVALGDVDSDGDLDLVVGNDGPSVFSVFGWVAPLLFPIGQQNQLYVNDGRGVFTDVTAARLTVDSDATEAVVLADIDGDGDLDVVCGTRNTYQPSNQNRLYVNDGNGAFADLTSARMPPGYGNTLALGDVDSDGDLDLVFGDGQNLLGTNLLRQLHAPSQPQVGMTYTLEAYARYGPSALFDVAVIFLSTTRVSVPVPPFGLLGIDPMVPLPTVVIPQPAGVGSVIWSVPSVPGTVGTRIYSQALVVSWPLGAKLTNVITDVVQ